MAGLVFIVVIFVILYMLYFYNPHTCSSHTFAMSQSTSMYTTSLRGGKSIGVYKNADTITGLEINEVNSDFTYINVSVYGVK